MSLHAMEQRVGLLCSIDGLLVLEWYFVTGSYAIPVVAVEVLLIAFVLAAVINNIFCWYFLSEARRSIRGSSMELMSQLDSMSEKLIFVGGIMKRDALFGMVLSATIIVNALALYLLLQHTFPSAIG